MTIDKDGLASLLERLRADVTVHQITGNGGMRRVADLAAAIDAITSLTARAEAAEVSLASAREDALEEAAKVAELDCDWSKFSRTSKKDWRGDETNIFAAPDDDDGTMPTSANVFAYRIGIASGRSIATAIRALKEVR